MTVHTRRELRGARAFSGRRPVVSLALFASVLLQPLGPAVHAAFAPHGHRLCAEHRRIEDVPKATQAQPSTPPVSPQLHEGAEDHPSACDVLNAVSAPAAPHLGDSCCRGAVVASCVPPPQRPPLLRPSSLILLAPKNSPPTTPSA